LRLPEPGGFIFLLSGPSGVGKGTLYEPLLAKHPRLGFSVSCTTRPPRPQEQEGREYHFLGRQEFVRQRGEGAFLEWAEVHGDLYGTRHRDVESMLAANRVVLLDIDVQGGLQVLDRYGDRVASVFVFPPSWEELARRLRGRHTESEAAIQRRLADARVEVAQAPRYGHYLVNDDLETARTELEAIYRAAGLEAGRWPKPPLQP
jgi:guanylate kinase